MRIGIDARSLETNPAGIGRYIHEISKILDELLPEAEFFLYSRTPILINKISNRWTHRCEPNRILRKIKSIVWLKFFSSRLIARDKIDFFWAAATFFPRLPSYTMSISTIHDINHVLVPETMPKLTLIAYKIFFKRDISRSDFVMSNSAGTANRVRELYGVCSDLVVRPGVSLLFRAPSDLVVKDSLVTLGIESPYILGLSTLEPRKNLVALIEAFSSLKSTGELINYKLVLVGGAGWGGGALDNLIKTTKDVVKLGYVADTYLPSLYRGAAAFVFPSLYEGFGIPVLEAMACGAKVVATDSPELREASSDMAIYIPCTVMGIKDGINLALKFGGGDAQFDQNSNSWRSQSEKLANLIKDKYAASKATV